MSPQTPSYSYQDMPPSCAQLGSGSHGTTSQPWTSHRPSQPPIVIPTIVDFQQPKPVSRRLSTVSVDVLRKWTHGNCILPDKSHPVWDYHERRNNQEVLPFLYLGPWGAVKDRNFLQEHRITMLLGARDTRYVQSRIMDGTKIANEVGIRYVSVDVSGPGELIAAFPRAIEQINTHLQEVHETSQAESPRNATFGKVLVFCESGNERSATIVAAYLMTMYEINMVDAIHVVQGHRFCASFSDPMKELLRSFEGILQAQRDVATATDLTPQEIREVQRNASASGHSDDSSTSNTNKPDNRTRWSHTSQLKRVLDEVYEDDWEMDEATSDQDQSTGRAGSAPFVDTNLLQ
jgi:serine/threonine/tyrosine-interacting protein